MKKITISIALVFLGLVLLVTAQMPVTTLIETHDPLNQAGVVIAYVILLYVLYRTQLKGLLDLTILKSKSLWGQIALFVVILFFMSTGIGGIIDALGQSVSNQDGLNQLLSLAPIPTLTYAIAFAPMIEETVCRYLFLSKLPLNPKINAVISTIVFILIHGAVTPLTALLYGSMNVFFIIFYRRHKSLVANMALHMSYNIFISILSLILTLMAG